MAKNQFAKLAALFLLGCALMMAAKIIRKNKATVEWNGERYDIQNVNALDAKFARPYDKDLDKLGNYIVALALVGAVIPSALVFISAKDKKSAFCDASFEGFVFVTCYLCSKGVYKILKTLAGRIRPYMYFANPSAAGIKEFDYCRSWPSGHSSMAFFAFAFLLLWFLVWHKDSKYKMPAIFAELSLCVATLVLRMLSGNHFLTDVLSGAAFGFATSAAVFLLATGWAAYKGQPAKLNGDGQ
ncbi:MAG: phosphatase PAP2 family protein [Treponema sp.]|nr:phosphatase PAP2 family protein [Treponema sp.]